MTKKVAKKSRVLVKAGLPAVNLDENITSALVLKGDLSGLLPEQRVAYYKAFCKHLGLNPVTQPFSIIRLQGRETLYATKMATDQLRTLRGVSITDLKGEMIGDCYRVTAIGHDKTGRTDAATGVVAIGNKHGDDLANATMKAETKAKRRLTLSLCGLGMLDESEIEMIPGARVEATHTDITGVLKESIDQVTKDGRPVYDIGTNPRDSVEFQSLQSQMNHLFEVAAQNGFWLPIPPKRVSGEKQAALKEWGIVTTIEKAREVYAKYKKGFDVKLAEVTAATEKGLEKAFEEGVL